MRHRSTSRYHHKFITFTMSHIHTVTQPLTHCQSQQLALLLTSLQSKVILALVVKTNEIFNHAVQVNRSCRMCHKNELVIHPILTGQLLCVNWQQHAEQSLAFNTCDRSGQVDSCNASTQTCLNSTSSFFCWTTRSLFRTSDTFLWSSRVLVAVKWITEQLQLSINDDLEVPLYHAHKLLTTILSLINYCQEVFRPPLKFPGWAMPTLIFSRVGTCPPRAGAPDVCTT